EMPDELVTGVQTCPLPLYAPAPRRGRLRLQGLHVGPADDGELAVADVDQRVRVDDQPRQRPALLRPWPRGLALAGQVPPGVKGGARKSVVSGRGGKGGESS